MLLAEEVGLHEHYQQIILTDTYIRTHNNNKLICIRKVPLKSVKRSKSSITKKPWERRIHVCKCELKSRDFVPLSDQTESTSKSTSESKSVWESRRNQVQVQMACNIISRTNANLLAENSSQKTWS